MQRERERDTCQYVSMCIYNEVSCSLIEKEKAEMDAGRKGRHADNARPARRIGFAMEMS